MNSQKKHIRMQLLETLPYLGTLNFICWRASETGLAPVRSPDKKGWHVPVITEIDISVMLSPVSNIPVVVATPGQYQTKVMLLNNDDFGDVYEDSTNFKNKASALWRAEDLVCWPEMDPAAPVVPGTPKRWFFTDQCEIPVTNKVYCGLKIEQDSEDLGGFAHPIGHVDWILEYKWVYFSNKKMMAELSPVGKVKNMVLAYDNWSNIPP